MIVPIRKSVLLSLVLLVCCAAMQAQGDPYRAEIGFQSGLNIYVGDANTVADGESFFRNLKNTQPNFGLMFRYRFNQRLAVRFGYDYTRVKGAYRYTDQRQAYSALLGNSLHLFDGWGEFNFFDLENNPHKRFSKRFSPYIFAGIGGVLTPQYKSAETNANFTFTIPYGVGMKWKIGERWNVNAQITNRLLLGDNMEGVRAFDNPAPTTIANPLNHDLLSGINIGISYDFWTRDCDCHGASSNASKKSAKKRR